MSGWRGVWLWLGARRRGDLGSACLRCPSRLLLSFLTGDLNFADSAPPSSSSSSSKPQLPPSAALRTLSPPPIEPLHRDTLLTHVKTSTPIIEWCCGRRHDIRPDASVLHFQ